MQTINLKQYYPFCKEDIFVEVSDEIVEAFLLDKRAEAARDRKMFRYKAFYSLDCNDGIENAAIGWAQPSPEDYLIEKEFGALSCEMEGASIAHVCYLNSIPFVVIRSISDNANNGAHMDFEKFTPIAVKHSTAILKEMVTSL